MRNHRSGLAAGSGASSHSTPRDTVTGNCAVAAGETESPATSEAGNAQSACSLPKWVDTDPAVLAGMIQDVLILMQQAKWFVYIMPITPTDGGRAAIRITIRPPKETTIGVSGNLREQEITINGKTVS